MELEKQVVSLDLSKKLKALGVKQKSLFQWIWGREEGDIEAADDDSQNKWVLDRHDGQWEMFLCKATCSAFTCSELGEMLPEIIKGHTLIIRKSNNGQEWLLVYQLLGHVLVDDPIHATTEADARATMLCYLIENNLLTLKEDRKK